MRKNSTSGTLAGVPLHLALAMTLAAFVFVAEFATNYDGAFVLDDAFYILTNRAVANFDPRSFEAWIDALFTSPSQIRPIPLLSFAWQRFLTGEDPVGFHLVNDLLHAMSAVALMFVLLEFFTAHLSEKLGERQRLRLAAAGALLWALHPVQTSAVTYITQRITVLSGLFGLTAFYFYLSARRTGHVRSYWGAAACYLLGLACKENLAVLPVLAALYEWLLGTPESPRARRERFTALGLAAVPPLLMAAAYALAGASEAGRYGTPVLAFSWGERLLSAPRVYTRYAWLLAFPLFQALDYGVSVSKGLFTPWSTLPAFLIVAVAVVFAWRERRRRPVAAFCILGFFLLPGPESTFLPLHLFFEHRLYLASAPVLPAIAVGMWRWLSANGLGARGAFAVLAVIALGWAVLSGLRNRDYADPARLWRENLVVQPDAERARASLALFLAKKSQLKESERLLREGLERLPDSLLLTQQLARVLEWAGEKDEAMEYYERAIDIAPDSAQVYFEYGNALYRYGETVAGIDALKKAAALEGPKSQGHRRLGLWLLQQGQYPAAIDELNRALKIKLADPAVHRALGWAYEQSGQVAKAYEHYEAACRIGDTDSCIHLEKRGPVLETTSPGR